MRLGLEAALIGAMLELRATREVCVKHTQEGRDAAHLASYEHLTG